MRLNSYSRSQMVAFEGHGGILGVVWELGSNRPLGCMHDAGLAERRGAILVWLIERTYILVLEGLCPAMYEFGSRNCVFESNKQQVEVVYRGLSRKRLATFSSGQSSCRP